jgi:6-phosphogluconolactonase (cycloisomerase 2 family)
MSIDTRSFLWTGSYTADSGGNGAGIGLLDAPVGRSIESLGTAAEVPSPSFLATHPTASVLYSVGEFDRTRVEVDPARGDTASVRDPRRIPELPVAEGQIFRRHESP